MNNLHPVPLLTDFFAPKEKVETKAVLDAIQNGNLEKLNYYLSQDVDLNAKDQNGIPLLYHAAKQAIASNNLNYVTAFTKKFGLFSFPTLETAIAMEEPEVIEILLMGGLNPSQAQVSSEFQKQSDDATIKNAQKQMLCFKKLGVKNNILTFFEKAPLLISKLNQVVTEYQHFLDIHLQKVVPGSEFTEVPFPPEIPPLTMRKIQIIEQIYLKTTNPDLLKKTKHFLDAISNFHRKITEQYQNAIIAKKNIFTFPSRKPVPSFRPILDPIFREPYLPASSAPSPVDQLQGIRELGKRILYDSSRAKRRRLDLNPSRSSNTSSLYSNDQLPPLGNFGKEPGNRNTGIKKYTLPPLEQVSRKKQQLIQLANLHSRPPEMSSSSAPPSERSMTPASFSSSSTPSPDVIVL